MNADRRARQKQVRTRIVEILRIGGSGPSKAVWQRIKDAGHLDELLNLLIELYGLDLADGPTLP